MSSREILIATNFGGVWAPSATGAGGHLFFMRDGTLMAQPFDAGHLKLIGEPVPVAEQVGTFGSNGFFSISANGSLAYRTGSSTANRQLIWFDREGKQSATAFDPGPYVICPCRRTGHALRPEGVFSHWRCLAA